MLYANGNNEKAISTKYPEGLVYYDGEVIFGVGVFKKHVEAEEIYVHIISPKGNNWNVKVEKFIKLLFEIENPKIYGIYIRQIDEIQFDNIKEQYNEISTNPWNVLAPQEDETYNHCFITLDDIIEKRGNNIYVKTLSGKENHNHRKKARMAYNRFNNFLKRNNLDLIFKKYSAKKYTDAKYIVDTHFKSLKKKSRFYTRRLL